MQLHVGTKEIHISWKIRMHFPMKQRKLELSNGPTLLTNQSNWSSSSYLFNRQSQTILNFWKCVIREIINLPIGLQYLPNNKCHVLIYIFSNHIHMVVKVKKIKIPYHLWKAWRCRLSRPIDLNYGNVYVNAIEFDSNWWVRNLRSSSSWNCH